MKGVIWRRGIDLALMVFNSGLFILAFFAGVSIIYPLLYYSVVAHLPGDRELLGLIIGSSIAFFVGGYLARLWSRNTWIMVIAAVLGCLVGLTTFEWTIVVGDFPKAEVLPLETYLVRQLWRRSVADVLWCAVCGLLAWCGYKVRFRQIVRLVTPARNELLKRGEYPRL